MKKSVLYLMIAIASMAFIPSVHATPIDPVTTEKNDTEKSAARANVLLSRLEEIKDMDKSELTRVERKELRKEVRAIKSELRTNNGGVYLSIGAIIIIILLLILLL